MIRKEPVGVRRCYAGAIQPDNGSAARAHVSGRQPGASAAAVIPPTLAQELRRLLASGAGAAIHCRSGIGRSSVLAATVLVLDGIGPQQTWALIATARGLPVADSAAQRDFILSSAQ